MDRNTRGKRRRYAYLDQRAQLVPFERAISVFARDFVNTSAVKYIRKRESPARGALFRFRNRERVRTLPVNRAVSGTQ